MAEITQDELNKSMVTLGVGRYRAKIESAKGRDAELETRYGQTLMRGALPLYTTKIGDWQKAVKDYATPARYQTELQLLEPKVIAYIATRAIIDSITKKRPLSQVAIYLGARLEDELRCRFLLENNEQKGSGILLGAKRRKGLNAKVRHVRSSMKKEAEKNKENISKYEDLELAIMFMNDNDEFGRTVVDDEFDDVCSRIPVEQGANKNRPGHAYLHCEFLRNDEPKWYSTPNKDSPYGIPINGKSLKVANKIATLQLYKFNILSKEKGQIITVNGYELKDIPYFRLYIPKILGTGFRAVDF